MNFRLRFFILVLKCTHSSTACALKNALFSVPKSKKRRLHKVDKSRHVGETMDPLCRPEIALSAAAASNNDKMYPRSAITANQNIQHKRTHNVKRAAKLDFYCDSHFSFMLSAMTLSARKRQEHCSVVCMRTYVHIIMCSEAHDDDECRHDTWSLNPK